MWHKKKPDVSHIRVFGCLCHMKVQSNQTTKLDDQSKQVINFGKEACTLIDSTTRREIEFMSVEMSRLK